jgi:hypothetical protein
MGHRLFLGKKHPYRAMDCQFNVEKENREAPLHVTEDMVHSKVKDIKTIEELHEPTDKTLGKRMERDCEEEKEGNVEQEINSMGARVLADVGCASFD